MVASKIHGWLEVEYGINLPKHTLIWGSVSPDFKRHAVSHFKDESIAVFYEKWQNLCIMDRHNKIEDFSIELGEIFHFLCDYFCYAHNEPYLASTIWPHLRYERYLYRFAKDRELVLPTFDRTDYTMIPFSVLLEYKHKLFLNRLPSFENDLQTSLEMCTIAVQKLFHNDLSGGIALDCTG